MRHVSKAPSTLTAAETKALLDATSRSDDDLRDHMVQRSPQTRRLAFRARFPIVKQAGVELGLCGCAGR